MLLDKCPRCQTEVHPRPRSRGWRVVLPVWLAAFVVMVLAAGMVGPFIIGLIPVLMVMGFAAGPLLSLIGDEPSCPRCGRTLAAPPTERELERSTTAPAMDLAA